MIAVPAVINDQLQHKSTEATKRPSPPSTTTTISSLSASDEPSASSRSLSLRSLPSSAVRKHPPPLIRCVHSFYAFWARFIVKNAWGVILFCTLVTTLCTVKVALTPQKNDITGYTPYGARSRQELATQEHFFNAQGLGHPFGVFVLLRPLRADDNFLRPPMLAEASLIDELVRTRFTLQNHRTNRTENFAHFCRDFCDLNEPLRRFTEAFQMQWNLLAANESMNSALQLNYPTSSILGRKFNIQPNFFGIQFRSTNSTSTSNTTTDIDSSQKQQQLISNMKRVDMVVLTYKAERIGAWTDDEIKEWEMGVSHYFEQEFKSPFVRVMTFSTTYVEVEVVRAGLSMLPFLMVGFAIMATCTSVSVLLSAIYWRQWHVQKLALALMACVCPFMACGTALGLLFLSVDQFFITDQNSFPNNLFPVCFGSVLCVTPFLVLAIGVDDGYLMMHAWQRVTDQTRRKRKTTPTLTANGADDETELLTQRLTMVLVETGPAVLISALTNICADAVGSFTGSPEITLLCVGNMAAMAVDFLYQITFYAAVMALVGRTEVRDEVSEQYTLKIPVGGWTEGNNGVENGKKQSKQHENRSLPPLVKRLVSSSMDGYVRFIAHPVTASLIFMAWIAFLAFSTIGISRFEVNLSTKKMFAEDSPLLEVDSYREGHIVPFFQMATVFINSPTNLSDPVRMARLNELVRDMEAIPGSWGPKSTNYFVRELDKFVGEEGELGPDQMEQFLDWPENRFWKSFIRIPDERNETDRGIVHSFYFTTGYHGQRLRVWAERTQLLMQWRAVVDHFPELNASVFHDESIFLDLIDNMPTDAWQSGLATLLCMCFICAVFMGHDWRTVGMAGTTIGSIIVGTLGTLSWIGATMDPIMMAALIISVGFSVDIPAHFSYHFHSAAYELQTAHGEASVARRLRATFASVCLPALQASLSTSLCVLSLLFVPLYMARIFVLIMCTTILLCVLHSFILLPALLALIDCATKCLANAFGKHRAAAATTTK
uniref:SSD domain-containing protein n=1 Tax=Globodera rostochiensis TaxID=31243 RepID=A0A914HEQ8_GLORO